MDIYEYIERDKPRAALALDETIAATGAKLIDRPESGRLGRVDGTREWIVHPNYILVYRVRADAIEILRVLHAARRWP
ncbi:MAG: type II toxin-antitoxin system RelE/ParE family toxin [Asticcacaulis sp.]|nr:type II toxin-antitoxin system RelE/ParE family toxin [Asticcacaulis sp.]